ncbi:tape measure protein [Clostridium baratii]
MATIRNAITMQDRMTPVFARMNNAMSSTLRVLQKVNSAANRGVASKEFKRAIKQADNALIKYKNNMTKANQETTNLGNSVNRLGGGGGLGFLNVYALMSLVQQGIGLVNKGAEYLDEMALMQARVKMINDGMQTTNELQDKILESANRARSSYKDTTAAITKLNMLAGDQFKNNGEAIAFVETLNKMFAISGTSSQEATAAMYQLTQAMGAGKLQGDEFRSIMENAPMLADAIAKSMGKSKGELKELAKDGEITAAVIKKAMTEATADVNKKFESIPMTFGQKMTIVKNNFMNTMEPVAARFSQWLNSSGGTAFFDSISKGLVTLAGIGVFALESIGNGILWVKENFDTLRPIIVGVGLAMVAAGIASAAAWTLAHLPLLAIIGTAIIITYIFNTLGIDIVNVVMTIIEWIYNLGSILYQLLPIIMAVGVAALMYFVIPLLMSLPMLIKNMIVFAVTTLAANWPLLLIAASIGLLIFIMNQFGITAADVVGFVVGLFYSLYAILYNIAVGIYNKFAVLATFLGNLFINPVGAIKMLFLDMATFIVDKVLWVAQSLQDLVNMIPGVEINITSGLENIKARIEATKQAVQDETGVKKTEFKEYKRVSTEFNKGFNKGSNFVNNIGGKGNSIGNLLDKFKMPSMPDGYGMDKGSGMFKPTPGIVPDKDKKGKKIKGGKLDKIKKIEDDVKITDEDIKMLKDIAKTEFVNKYTTLRPNMNVEFSGPIKETADINKIMGTIEDMVEEALSNVIVEGA